MRVNDMFRRYVLKYSKRFNSEIKSDAVPDSWLRRNGETVLGGSIIAGLSYFIYHTYKKNQVVTIRILPPMPSTGVVPDDSRIEDLLEKFKTLKNRVSVKYMCLYGNLGCGKSILASNLCQKLVPSSRSSIFKIPQSSILVFLDCNSSESLTESLVEFYNQLLAFEKSKHTPSLKDIGSPTDVLSTFENPHDLFSSTKLDLPTNQLVDFLMYEISCVLARHPGWFIVLDNINSLSYGQLSEFFQKYILNDYFHDQKGSFLLVCDTSEPILPDFPNSYRLSGLSLDAAFKLFIKHSCISPESIKINDVYLSSILQLTHSQPLSVVSIALLVKNCLIKNPNQSIKDAIKNVEDSILIHVMDQIQKFNINISPESFEILFSQNAVKMAINEFDSDPNRVALKLLTVLSILSPSILVPETVSSKILNNLNIEANAVDMKDICEAPDYDFLSDFKGNKVDTVIRILKEGPKIYKQTQEYTQKVMKLDPSVSSINISERLATTHKKSPFLNITFRDHQDYFSMHPLVYVTLKNSFFEKQCYLFEDKSTVSLPTSSMFWSYFSFQKIVKIVDLWQRNYFNQDIIDETNSEDRKFVILEHIVGEVLNCLSHKDPVRLIHRKKLTFSRSNHLKYLLSDFVSAKNKIKESEVLSQNDIKFMARLYISLSSALNDIRMFSQSLSTSNQALTFLKENMKNSNHFTSEIIDGHLTKGQALLALKMIDEATECVKSLWKMVEPYNPLSYPIASVKLLLLILNLENLTNKKIAPTPSLDLTIHILQKINLACMSSSLPVEQLAEDMMEAYIFYGLELIKSNRFHYASYLIHQAEIFNLEIFKGDNYSRKSPFDEKIMKLKIFFESFRGNLKMVETLKKKYYEDLGLVSY